MKKAIITKPSGGRTIELALDGNELSKAILLYIRDHVKDPELKEFIPEGDSPSVNTKSFFVGGQKVDGNTSAKIMFNA